MPEQNQAGGEEQQQQPQMNILQMVFMFFAIQMVMNNLFKPSQPQSATQDFIKQYNETYNSQLKVDQPQAPQGLFGSMFGFAKDIMPVNMGVKGKVYKNALHANQLMKLQVYYSESDTQVDFSEENLLWSPEAVAYSSDSSNYREYNVTLPINDHLLNNGTAFAHIFFCPIDIDIDPKSSNYDEHLIHHAIYGLTKYKLNLTEEAGINLLNATSYEIENSHHPKEVLDYWVPMVHMSIIPMMNPIKGGSIPPNMKMMTLDEETSTYMPGLKINEIYLMNKYLIELNSTVTSLPIAFSFSVYSMIKGSFFQQIDTVLDMQKGMGMASDNDMDDIKSMFLETNIYLLLLTGVVSTLHSVFDFLAFKNDIQFWRSRNNMEGLSVRTIFMNCFVNLIVLLYLLNNETSFTIILSNFAGLLIELWKVTKAVNIRFYFKGNKPVLRITDKASYGSSKTKEYDQIAMKHLMMILYPLVAGYAIYSLVYETHKNWYSWILTSLTNFVYLFGFISMTPQLFINYKLHSVAHIPMNAMIYKTLNTFIDDLFSFVIKMPTLHRIACFRDDIIFFIFLYQKWIYPVDKTRKNEYGFSELDLEQINSKGKETEQKSIHRKKTDRLQLD
ncbi:hypothetical protein WA158_008096 [Blastocystis sp. Blastoise]